MHAPSLPSLTRHLVPACLILALPCAAQSAAWTIKQPAASPTGRGSQAMSYDVVRQRVVLFGGQTASSMLNDTWEWDGQTWRQRAPLVSPSPRKLHTMV